jgi:heptosyltransferase-2
MQPSKILIIQTAFLGDLILTTPFLHLTRITYPDAIIDLIVNQGSESVLENNPDINSIISLNKKNIKKNPFKFLGFAFELRKKKYDLVLSPHFSYRSTLLSWITGSKTRIGYKESGFSFLHTHTVTRPKKGPHEVDKLFSLILDDPSKYPIGRERRPYLFIKENDPIKNRLNFTNPELGYVVIAPSSLWETKRYPEEGFIGLCRSILQRTGMNLILVGSKMDRKITKNIYQGLLLDRGEWSERIIDMAGETTLQELAYLISKARIIISNDSSPVHFASAFNIPTLIIYGATIPEFGYSSLSDNHLISEILGLSCRPCGIHGGNYCPEKHFKCMLNQKPENLFEKFKIINNQIGKLNET